ncbi:hypothetical protein [Mycobacterium phage PP]|uniref:Uncharacterized protein n=1 Tax=Mycobacterium phage PP TaxID=2077134 RepID=A0A2Z5XVI7_9CAUD|nr:hypothetical protein KIW36_gp23 [Mycobacterium phage PP]BBC53868.1 hypothetical protein [Mycobacterium phage PP]
MHKAKCRDCSFGTNASSAHLIGLAVRVHETRTGHSVEVKMAAADMESRGA